MKDTFLSARLVEPNLIRMMLFTSALSEKVNAILSIDHAESFVLSPSRRSSMNGIASHIFENTNLTDKSCFIDSCS